MNQANFPPTREGRRLLALFFANAAAETRLPRSQEASRYLKPSGEGGEPGYRPLIIVSTAH